MAWVYFTLLAVFFWSLSNIIDKHIVSRYIKNPTIFIIFLSVLSLIAAFIVSIFQDITIPSFDILFLSLISGIAYFIGVFLYVKSLRIEEISRVVPLFSITSIFVLILATIFLNEIFTLEKYLGIFLIIAGVILISLRKKVKFSLSKALLLMIIASLFIAIHYTLQKFVLNNLTYWNAFFWIRIGSFLAAPLLLYFYYKPLVKTIKKNPIGGVYLSISEGLNIIGIYSIVIAFSIGYASLVSILSEIQPLFVLFIATILSAFNPKIIKEELKGSVILLKFIAIVMIIFGAALIA